MRRPKTLVQAPNENPKNELDGPVHDLITKEGIFLKLDMMINKEDMMIDMTIDIIIDMIIDMTIKKNKEKITKNTGTIDDSFKG